MQLRARSSKLNPILNLSTEEAKAARFLGVGDLPGLHNETIILKTQRTKNPQTQRIHGLSTGSEDIVHLQS